MVRAGEEAAAHRRDVLEAGVVERRRAVRAGGGRLVERARRRRRVDAVVRSSVCWACTHRGSVCTDCRRSSRPSPRRPARRRQSRSRRRSQSRLRLRRGGGADRRDEAQFSRAGSPAATTAAPRAGGGRRRRRWRQMRRERDAAASGKLRSDFCCSVCKEAPLNRQGPQFFFFRRPRLHAALGLYRRTSRPRLRPARAAARSPRERLSVTRHRVGRLAAGAAPAAAPAPRRSDPPAIHARTRACAPSSRRPVSWSSIHFLNVAKAFDVRVGAPRLDLRHVQVVVVLVVPSSTRACSSTASMSACAAEVVADVAHLDHSSTSRSLATAASPSRM